MTGCATLFRLFTILFGLTVTSLGAEPRAGAPREIFFADPTIYTQNGRYYLTGTQKAEPQGFSLLESDNLREWRPLAPGGRELILRAGDGSYGTALFWAPQILEAGAEYLLAYSANEHVALARSRALDGPYRQNAVEPIDDSERNIDPYLFRDDDGRCYLYHVRFRRGNFIWVADFDLASGRINPRTLTRCFGPTQPWEATPAYASDPIMEGPAVLKLKGKYYLFYSANHFRSVDYAVGYAVSNSPVGPWVKNDRNPILHRSIVGENGSGHGDIFRGPEGKFYYVYHVHYSNTAVSPRRTRIVQLVLTWDESRAQYDIAVDPSTIIRPTLNGEAVAR